MAGRDLEDALKECATAGPPEIHGMPRVFNIPAGGHPGGEQCFHFGSHVQGVVVKRVIQWLDAEAIARSKQRVARRVPKHERKFAAQAMQCLRPEILVEVQGDLAVRSRAEVVPRTLELGANRLEVVELAIDDDAGLVILAGDRLRAGRQVDDAQPGMTEGHAPILRHPVFLGIRAAVLESLNGALNGAVRDRTTGGVDCNNTAHVSQSYEPWAARTSSATRSREVRARGIRRQGRSATWTKRVS